MKKIIKFLTHLSVVRFLAAFLIALYIKILYFTLRLKVENKKEIDSVLQSGHPVIVLAWHGRSILVSQFWTKYYKKKPAYALFSTHRDGLLMSRIFGNLGIRSILGSSNRSSMHAVKDMLKALKKGYTISLTPDGPIGPRMRLTTDSSLYFAKKTGAAIVPIYVSVRGSKILPTWDRYMFPRLFRSGVFRVGKSLFVPSNISNDDMHQLKEKLEKRMIKESQQLDREMGLPKIDPQPKDLKHKRKDI